MGCNLCRSVAPRCHASVKGDAEQHTESKKEYSWDKKDRVNPKDFTFDNLKGETLVKLPGSIKGQQFIIQNCENCNIYLCDYTNTITVDDCINCNVVLGPTKGSVFLRNCEDCHFLVACQQFRTRDCKMLDVFLFSTTHPIIEASSKMRFGCYCCAYSKLEDQFHCAGLSVFNNEWCDIHDFTPVEGESNWSLMPEDVSIGEFIPLPVTEELTTLKFSFDFSEFVIPYTHGLNECLSEASIILFFNDGHSHARALSFIRNIKLKQPKLKLIRTREVNMSKSDAQRVLQLDSYNAVVDRGPVIGLEYNGEGSIEACQTTAKEIAKDTGSTGLVYVPSHTKTSLRQIKEFFNLTDMQMAG